jgi:hypothetical protein
METERIEIGDGRKFENGKEESESGKFAIT